MVSAKDDLEHLLPIDFEKGATLYPAASAARSFHNAALEQRVEAQGANVMAMTNQAITRLPFPLR
jgi:hypothetical protein